MWQHGGVSLSPRGFAAGPGVGGGQEHALEVIFFSINETHYLQCILLSLVCWLWDSIWMIVTVTLARFSSLLCSLYTYTYTYTYCYYYCIVLTKPAPAWVPVKASFSTSDTIVILYRHRSTNRFVSLLLWAFFFFGFESTLLARECHLNSISKIFRKKDFYIGSKIKPWLDLTPVAGRIFETKNRAIFLERFFGRGIFAQNSFLGQKMSLDFK